MAMKDKETTTVKLPAGELRQTVRDVVIDESGRRLLEIDEEIAALNQEKKAIKQSITKSLHVDLSRTVVQHVVGDKYDISIKTEIKHKIDNDTYDRIRKEIEALPDGGHKEKVIDVFNGVYSVKETKSVSKRGLKAAASMLSPDVFRKYVQPCLVTEEGSVTIKVNPLDIPEGE